MMNRKKHTALALFAPLYYYGHSMIAVHFSKKLNNQFYLSCGWSYKENMLKILFL